MHIAVSWDIAAQGQTWQHENNRLLDVIKPYSWVRPLNTFYVIQVADADARKAILNGLQQAAQTAVFGTQVHVLVSPLMLGGSYEGFLPTSTWAELNARTQ